MRILAEIQGERIMEFPSGRVMFFADADIDADGSGGNLDDDPWFQPDTTYHFRGRALNSYTTNFIAIPPQIVTGVRPVVLGCHCRVLNLANGKRGVAIAGDIGPRSKIGEVSVALARMLGIDANPVTGGMEEHDLLYEIFPGIPAQVEGVLYPLQPYGA